LIHHPEVLSRRFARGIEENKARLQHIEAWKQQWQMQILVDSCVIEPQAFIQSTSQAS
jgi:hypothetical protein